MAQFQAYAILYLPMTGILALVLELPSIASNAWTGLNPIPPSAPLPSFVLKDILETPNPSIYFVTSLFALLCTSILRKHPECLKAVWFYYASTSTMVLRALAEFSDLDDGSLEMGSMAIILVKPIILLWIIRLSFWDWTYLGTYRDEYLDPRRYIDVFPSWRDVALRLSYISVFDSIIHCLRLRFVSRGHPYTPGLNNSECLTIVILSLS
ncbi:hypothetical protein K469DRAFT_749872 [Zopfia rhizophila CBS 207.26]|uniref:Uncharacterized protein n=1 Tax=Zopfia rhizophila CBS 207.26 TaxID=1314779 RepID=A0A6A6E535_9PEZI|nr:hypothetical protein K469DRAFT_749872 [Zopfia rhizophila CBS 207.26]